MLHQPDACLLDMSFPDASGLGAIARIHEVSTDTKVVMLSGSISRGLVADAIAHGAQGFVGKEKPVAVIVEALMLAHQGSLAVDPIFLDSVPSEALIGELMKAPNAMTDRQWDLLRSPADGPGALLATAEDVVPPAAASTRLLQTARQLRRSSRFSMAGLLKADS